MATNPIDALLNCPAFESCDPSNRFIQAAESCLTLLRSRFPRYAAFLNDRAMTGTGPITGPKQIHSLPALFLPVLKSIQLPMPRELVITVELTSSGTTGKPSVTPLDEESWQRRVQAMLQSYQALGLFQGEMTALAFLMDPTTTRMAGSLVIDAVLKQAPQVHAISYLGRMQDGKPEFQPARAVAALNEAARRGPVLLVGYPALMAATMHALLKEGNIQLPLPQGSCVLTGGGWKSFLPGVNLDQPEFRRQVAGCFKLPPSAIRDMFGLSECPAVFVQCEHGNYHVPAWAWAQAIDPETNAEVPDGGIGLLQLTVPLTTSYPLLKILTTDKVTLNQECPCARPARFLVPKGRVTAARYETCAMKMGEAL